MVTHRVRVQPTRQLMRHVCMRPHGKACRDVFGDRPAKAQVLGDMGNRALACPQPQRQALKWQIGHARCFTNSTLGQFNSRVGVAVLNRGDTSQRSGQVNRRGIVG